MLKEVHIFTILRKLTFRLGYLYFIYGKAIVFFIFFGNGVGYLICTLFLLAYINLELGWLVTTITADGSTLCNSSLGRLRHLFTLVYFCLKSPFMFVFNIPTAHEVLSLYPNVQGC